ncbi:MAG: signal transduction histidine kinase [Oleiphilaceae bacterium]|jgi:signal transduction histidine kinase
MSNKNESNILYFYNKAKDFFTDIEISKTPILLEALKQACPNTKPFIIYNTSDSLTVCDNNNCTELELTDLLDALPLLFQSYSYTKIEPADVSFISTKLNMTTEKYLDGACFALEIDGRSLWFVFLKSEFQLDEFEEKVISDIYVFLKDLISFSANVAQGATLTENLRNEKKKQSIWLESLAWLNDLGNQEYSDDELKELYKSALFQLKMLVRADHAEAFLVEENSRFKALISYSDKHISQELIEILTDDSVLKNFEEQKNFSLVSTENQMIKNLNITTLNIYPLFFQKKLKLVLLVSRNTTYFDEHESMIASLFSEGLEHIIVRMYFLRTMRHQNVSLKKEKLEQQILISKLRDAQEQLLQNEKMASIGQLAAGVAHEINNPVGYVNSNINSLDGYITDIYDILELYQVLEETVPEDNKQRKEIKALKADIDFDFIRTDIKELLSESKEGVLRVKQIVKDLKDFSHVDEAEWQLTDIEKGMDSTLNIVLNELKYKAKIYKDYGKTPEVECNPSQINQILMNLMVNAGHSIDEQGSITLITRQLDDKHVYIEVVDTGKGIPEENLTKIFDPFFTTKPVGQGTGLGLSLSYSIAEKHGGELSVKSVVGEGTTFRLTLPIKNFDGEKKDAK